MAETEGFEPSVQMYPYDGLANRWFQPLTHVSKARTSRVRVIPRQAPMREKREDHQFLVAQSAAQSVHDSFAQSFSTLWGRMLAL